MRRTPGSEIGSGPRTEGRTRARAGEQSTRAAGGSSRSTTPSSTATRTARATTGFVTDAIGTLGLRRHPAITPSWLMTPAAAFSGASSICSRTAFTMGLHCRGAMSECDARTQGAAVSTDTGATEDAAARRPARPSDTTVHRGSWAHTRGDTRRVERRRISSGSPYEPVFGFSRAFVAGRHVYVSGTAPVMPDGGEPPDGHCNAQARRCLEIIVGALADAGARSRTSSAHL